MDVLTQQHPLEDFSEPVSPMVELQLSMCKQFMNQLANSHHTIDQLTAIKEQSDLMRLIQERLQSRPQPLPVEPEETDSSKFRLLTENSILKRPGGKDGKSRLSTQPSEEARIRKRVQLNQTDIYACLAEVEQKCGRDTYEVLYQLAAEHRIQKQKMGSMRTSEMEWQRVTKENLLLKQTSGELQTKLKSLESQIKSQQAQLNQAKKALNEKERSLTKMQTSLLIKDKLLGENMKSICAKTESLKKQQQSQSIERKYLDGVWDTVITKLDSMPGGELANFKTTVYTKCKENLLKQRSILQEEQEQLDRQHTYIQKIINQLQGVAPAEIQSAS